MWLSTAEIFTAPGVDFTTSALTQTRNFLISDSVGTMKCISVTIIDDEITDPDEMFRVRVTPSSTRVTVGGSTTETVTVTIINDDSESSM